MSKRMVLLASLAMSTSPSIAAADLSAQALWTEWQAFYDTLDVELTAGSEQYDGSVLTLSDVRIGIDYGAQVMRGALDELVLEERPDGSVRVTQSPVISVFSGNSDADMETTTEVRFEGAETIVTESGMDRTYASRVDRYTTELVSMTVSGEPQPMTQRLEGLNANSEATMRVGSPRVPFAMTATMDQVTTVQSFAVDDDAAAFSISQQVNMVSSTAEGFADEELAFGPLSFGFNLGGVLSYENSVVTGGGNIEGTPFDLQLASGPGALEYGFGLDGLLIAQTVEEADVRVTIPGVPFPFEGSADEITIGLATPLTQSTTDADFKLTLALRDLVLSDVIWGLFDGGGAIPRTPISVVVDVEGQGRLVADDFATLSADTQTGNMPVNFTSARINELLVEMGGARLVGEGAVAFDPSANGLPSPIGAVDLTLDGGFALLDALSAAGFVPPQQADMIRGMSGMFTTQTGPDTLSSELRFMPGGGLSVNGTLLR